MPIKITDLRTDAEINALIDARSWTKADNQTDLTGSKTTVGNITISSYKAEMFTSFLRTNWTLGTGWDSTNVSDTKILKNAAGTGTATLLNVPAVVGTLYKVVITVESVLFAGCNATFGGASCTTMNTAATYTNHVVATSTAGLIFTPTASGSAFTINAISIRPVGGVITAPSVFAPSPQPTMGMNCTNWYGRTTIVIPTGASPGIWYNDSGGKGWIRYHDVAPSFITSIGQYLIASWNYTTQGTWVTRWGSDAWTQILNVSSVSDDYVSCEHLGDSVILFSRIVAGEQSIVKVLSDGTFSLDVTTEPVTLRDQYVETDTPTTDPGWASSSTVDMNAPDGYIKACVGTQRVVIPYWNT